MTKCSSCGAEIIWAETIHGRIMPVDAKPESRLTLTDRTGDPLPRETPLALHVQTHTSHFATCPNADSHRKKR